MLLTFNQGLCRTLTEQYTESVDKQTALDVASLIIGATTYCSPELCISSHIGEEKLEGTIMADGSLGPCQSVAMLPLHRQAWQLGAYRLHLSDAFAWLEAAMPNSIHAIVTDPPYGLKEYSDIEKQKLRAGRGGIWRIPPSFDGCKRSPLPRFTVLDSLDREALRAFFSRFATLALRALVPGSHVFIATNPLLSHLVYNPMMDAGFEKRGEIIRLVQTLRGGDRPKNAHTEFSGVSVMPRSGWEPWGLFRKPCEGRVQDNLRKWGTGGLRRVSEHDPFSDVIRSAPTRREEKAIASHPSLKPQAFMRQIVRAALPMGEGVILDPFMGAGSTIAAAARIGYESIGIEIDPVYYRLAEQAIPALAQLTPKEGGGNGGATQGSRTNSYREGCRHVRREGSSRH
jgi:site-specific DNA-methyltransferase (adenine-specific)